MSKGTYTPQFDVVGPYKLNHPSLYYGKGDKDNTDALVSDACKAADKDVDFSEYDADGDGMVDLVYIIYAGYPASMSGNPNDIWPNQDQVMAVSEPMTAKSQKIWGPCRTQLWTGNEPKERFLTKRNRIVLP